MARKDHEFQFSAEEISASAADEARYHEGRVAYWEGEFEAAYATVEATIGVKITRAAVTGGETFQVVVDQGDPAAYRRLGLSQRKIDDHRNAAVRFRTDEQVYGTQGSRTYELSVEDVHHYRLGGGPRED